MNYEVEKIVLGNHTAIITYDEYAEDPRTTDTYNSVMYCEHKRYTLGDKHDLDFSECTSWEDHEKVVLAEHGTDAIILPLYLYDHSSITMSTEPFSCKWDSGRVGTIAISLDTARKEYGGNRSDDELKSVVIEALKSEIEVYDMYITNDVYNVSIVENDDEDEIIDSCSGFFGLDYAISSANDTLKMYESN